MIGQSTTLSTHGHRYRARAIYGGGLDLLTLDTELRTGLFGLDRALESAMAANDVLRLPERIGGTYNHLQLALR